MLNSIDINQNASQSLQNMYEAKENALKGPVRASANAKIQQREANNTEAMAFLTKNETHIQMLKLK